MILYPAIDLKDGRCVRLRQGDMAQATIFNEDPAAQAKSFESAGFRYLHCIDLDGAFAGHSANSRAIAAILSALTIPVQLGGGIRSRDAIEHWLAAGVTRVILGTAALRDPELVNSAARAYPGRIVVGIDARDGMVAVQGWAETSSMPATDLAQRFEDAGVAAIIFTDIARDGMMQGVNVQLTAAFAQTISIPVIASGGVNGVRDIELLMKQSPLIQGVVIGRALYDGRLAAGEALAAAGPQVKFS